MNADKKGHLSNKDPNKMAFNQTKNGPRASERTHLKK